MSNSEHNGDDVLNITIVKYHSGLGQPGIMPPKLSSTVEITRPPTQSAKVVKTEYTDNKPSNSREGEMTDSTGLTTVLAMVDELKALPAKPTPGGPDVFGANTVVVVREGRKVVWGYNPGGGCNAAEDPSEFHASVTDDHRAKFIDIVNKIDSASNGVVA
ncbi:hypothetical protein GGI25_005186 [Coemansia spiralis]|uniref:Uncharacterized protein n=2 Tax=Coemansia TaxID=4863 RepID=A0A9W8G3P1_9FUNG|nr:hypothetical protein BX070DRAFT_252905 [Coemansia spiralis]KAJ1992266.1 hypothetical protein EDC05_002934 [Coemansia umbellata]KAJ2623380.1 hypothetical protein GGI26_002418 [Coemansia sp. RSA 1358]KAJ2672259.1 hypothetical protein GGI25_005186 [Coemansia spiralis]